MIELRGIATVKDIKKYGLIEASYKYAEEQPKENPMNLKQWRKLSLQEKEDWLNKELTKLQNKGKNK